VIATLLLSRLQKTYTKVTIKVMPIPIKISSLDLLSVEETLRHQMALLPDCSSQNSASDDGLTALLLKAGRCQSWKSGDMLVRQGDAVDQVSLCLSGSFRVMINSADGQAMLLRFLKPGELFGLPSIFAGAAFPTDVVCEREGDTLSVSKIVLEKFLVERPILAVRLIESLSSRVAELFSLIEANLIQTLRQRVRLRLIALANINGDRLPDGSIRLSLSQQDFARAVNASRQKVQRELKRMEREGLVLLGYRSITLLRLQKL
jgi:CRP/FNR family transcriptional regulator/CRP/FNR family cyclic AMP-dependent transcriptional regulator